MMKKKTTWAGFAVANAFYKSVSGALHILLPENSLSMKKVNRSKRIRRKMTICLSKATRSQSTGHRPFPTVFIIERGAYHPSLN
jgi:hypothetical protein